MDAKTLRALKGSIRKWEKIVEGTGINLGPLNCPLCMVFIRHDYPFNMRCRGCPVFEKTGLTGCRDTPYETFHDLMNGGGADQDQLHGAAIEEVAFLRSLLPAAPRASAAAPAASESVPPSSPALSSTPG